MNNSEKRRYRASLKAYMGYQRERRWATAFDDHCINVLADLLNPDKDHMAHFLTRYPKIQRPWRKRQVILVICEWLGEMAAGLDNQQE